MAKHRYLCPMRWADMDIYQHINNSAFFSYLEQARIDLFFERARELGVSTIADGVVVARHEIDYARPVVYRHEPLAIDVWCSRIGGASFTVDYEVYDADVRAATARTMCVAYDMQAGRARRLSAAERSFLTDWLEPTPEP
jgi:acyl-CoA thioester hydrolase